MVWSPRLNNRPQSIFSQMRTRCAQKESGLTSNIFLVCPVLHDCPQFVTATLFNFFVMVWPLNLESMAWFIKEKTNLDQFTKVTIHNRVCLLLCTYKYTYTYVWTICTHTKQQLKGATEGVARILYKAIIAKPLPLSLTQPKPRKLPHTLLP